jgi:hypothetical protein
MAEADPMQIFDLALVNHSGRRNAAFCTRPLLAISGSRVLLNFPGAPELPSAPILPAMVKQEIQ